MLHGLRKHGHFWEEPLVGRASHNLVRVSLRAAVRTYNHHGGTEILDKVPTGTCDGEDVRVCADVPKNLESSMMLEQEIHFYTDATDVLEHVRELHIFRVRSKAVKTKAFISLICDLFTRDALHLHVMIINLQNMGDLCKRLP